VLCTGKLPSPCEQLNLTDLNLRGESGVGDWIIVVKDTLNNKHTGTFTDWHLKLWGEARDASKAKLLPMPTEEDDDDHAAIPTTTAQAITTTILPNPATTQTSVASIPTDIPDRPVKPKPTQTSDTAQPSPTQDEQAAQTSPSTWLPSFLPTLGVSASTRAWIYGAATLIIVFCFGLGIYLWMARRKRLRNNARENYEFELLDEEEAEGLASGEKVGAAGNKARRTRGGELYDAFAGGSDEEDDFDVAGAYHDRADDVSPRVSEKQARGASDSEGEEDEHHVIGDDDSDDDNDRRPLPR
jgi:kexin